MGEREGEGREERGGEVEEVSKWSVEKRYYHNVKKGGLS